MDTRAVNWQSLKRPPHAALFLGAHQIAYVKAECGSYVFGAAFNPAQPPFLESESEDRGPRRVSCLPMARQLTSPSAGTATNTTLKLANVA